MEEGSAEQEGIHKWKQNLQKKRIQKVEEGIKVGEESQNNKQSKNGRKKEVIGYLYIYCRHLLNNLKEINRTEG